MKGGRKRTTLGLKPYIYHTSAVLIDGRTDESCEMTPYPGWRFITDVTGVIHHVPTHETLERMVAALGEDWFAEGEKK